jgi:hypothetical protein
MTSDNIQDGDWSVVKDFSVKIAEAQCAGDEAGSDYLARELLRYLMVLEQKYGAAASIVATRADYVDSTAERIRLLEQAWALARKRSDWANCVFVSSSLAAAHVEELGVMLTGRRWLALLEESLEHYWDEDEYKELKRLKAYFDGEHIGGDEG